jgi:hypothetical protein
VLAEPTAPFMPGAYHMFRLMEFPRLAFDKHLRQAV